MGSDHIQRLHLEIQAEDLQSILLGGVNKSLVSLLSADSEFQFLTGDVDDKPVGRWFERYLRPIRSRERLAAFALWFPPDSPSAGPPYGRRSLLLSAALMEMPAAWLLTSHQVHLLK